MKIHMQFLFLNFHAWMKQFNSLKRISITMYRFRFDTLVLSCIAPYSLTDIHLQCNANENAIFFYFFFFFFILFFLLNFILKYLYYNKKNHTSNNNNNKNRRSLNYQQKWKIKNKSFVLLRETDKQTDRQGRVV